MTGPEYVVLYLLSSIIVYKQIFIIGKHIYKSFSYAVNFLRETEMKMRKDDGSHIYPKYPHLKFLFFLIF